MGNKVKYNLKNVHEAHGAVSKRHHPPTRPRAIPGAVSISLNAEGVLLRSMPMASCISALLPTMAIPATRNRPHPEFRKS